MTYFPSAIDDKPIDANVLDELGIISKHVNGTNTADVAGVYYPEVIQSQMHESVTAQNLVSTSLDTLQRRILSNYGFSQTGSIQIGRYVSGQSGDIRISPNGIVGRNSTGSTTFTLDGTSGDLTLAGYVKALGGSYASSSTGARVEILNPNEPNVGFHIFDNSGNDVLYVNVAGSGVGDLVIGDYSGGHGMLWDKSASRLYIKGDLTAGNINANTITTGDVPKSAMQANVLDALKFNVSTLSAITAYIGDIQTSASNPKVEISGTDNKIKFYNGGGNLCGEMYGASGVSGYLVLDGAYEIYLNTVKTILGTDGSSWIEPYNSDNNLCLGSHFSPVEVGGRLMVSTSDRDMFTEDFGVNGDSYFKGYITVHDDMYINNHDIADVDKISANDFHTRSTIYEGSDSFNIMGSIAKTTEVLAMSSVKTASLETDTPVEDSAVEETVEVLPAGFSKLDHESLADSIKGEVNHKPTLNITRLIMVQNRAILDLKAMVDDLTIQVQNISK